MWYCVYNLLVLPWLWGILYALSFVQPKARRLVHERRQVLHRFEAALRQLPAGAPRIALHCASFGEWEQARQLLDALRHRRPHTQFIVTFFSTSGYRQFTPEGDHVVGGYLPLDFPWAARRYFALARPDVWIIVKHDVWPNHVRMCARAGIPVVLIDANLHPGSRRLWPVARGLYRAVFRQFRAILAVSEEDAHRFRSLWPGEDVIAVGDTRFDRVVQRTEEYCPATHDVLPADAGPVLVAGSTWPSDEAQLVPAVARLLTDEPRLRVVWVPHEPTPQHLTGLERGLARHGVQAVRHSAGLPRPAARVVIVDRVGVLAHIYRVAAVAYVGGSFGSGVHNVIEPAVLGKPVLFGPHYRNAFEAQELVRCGGGVVVRSPQDVYARVSHWLHTGPELALAGKTAREAMLAHLGATDRIVTHMERLGLA